PDPRTAPGDAPLARGGDLRPETLVDAYAHGVFPWPDAHGRLWWWSPDPRAVIPLDGLRVSRSLRRTLGRGRLSCSLDRAFARVVRGCADRPGEGTWIRPEMVAAYTRLHELGVAHSIEVWDRAGTLVGGLYGVAIGGAFTGESMFHRVDDASKVALVHLVERLRAGGFALLDAQLQTPHLASLGAVEVPRARFLDRLADAVQRPAGLPPPGPCPPVGR
ncbi:MAG: leucyl/phenylalanyl-tRNA--protein transferase, partial [Actinomycetota bacterium]|nr:leucyl/phenylalanyl-tRNA--protein transferase [Actinomycetota bacterium]